MRKSSCEFFLPLAPQRKNAPKQGCAVEGRHPGRTARPGACNARPSAQSTRSSRGSKRTVWDDASFRQVEDAVDKMPADSDEVVLRCMAHAVNTSESFQAAEVAVIMRASRARVCVCVGHAVEQVFMRRCLCFSCSSMPCSFHST